jgi:hypothetical protein
MVNTTPLDEVLMPAAAPAPKDARTASKSTVSERTLWVIGSTADAFAAVAPVLESILDRYPRISTIYTTRDPALLPWLRAHAPAALVAPRPPTFPLAAARAVRRHNPRLVLLLDGIARFEGDILRVARHRQSPIALMATEGTALTGAPPALLDLVERFIAFDEDGAGALRAVASVQPRVTIAAEADRSRAVTAAADALLPLLRRDLKVQRSEQRSEHQRRASRRRCGRSRVDASDRQCARGAHRDGRGSRDAFAAPADDPLSRQRPLVRGPAPTRHRLRRAVSREPPVAGAGFLTDPDVVFTGSTETVRRMTRPSWRPARSSTRAACC